MKQGTFGMISVLLVAAGAIGGGVAQAASCQVPLRNVLVADQDCAYYETAFRIMATDKISVHSACIKGSFSGPNGVKYGSQVVTTLTVHDTTCAKMKPLELNPVLLSKPNCPNLKTVVAMLSTDFVGVDPVCSYGKWTGADGSPRSSMVATRMTLRSQVAAK